MEVEEKSTIDWNEIRLKNIVGHAFVGHYLVSQFPGGSVGYVLPTIFQMLT